jgi:RNA polymerase sigma-70 factor (ECF subfamily)
MSEEDSVDLLARWRNGDRLAGEELFSRYTEQLLALARRQLSPRLAPRFDPEDVVQSAYRSFCAGVADGRFLLQRSGDLWRLLAKITLHKLYHQVAHHTADKRSIAREQLFATASQLDNLDAEIVARGPSPVDVAIAAEELESILRKVRPPDRRIVELRLQGCTNTEVAAAVDRSDRWVRRVLEQLEQRLEERYCELVRP